MWLKSKESSCSCTRCWFRFLHQEDHLEKEMAPTPVLLPGKSFGQRSLEGYSSWGRKETQVSKQQQETRNSHKHVNIPFGSFYRGRKPTMRLELKQHPYTLHSSTSFSSLLYLNQAQNLCQFSELLVFSISGQREYLLPNLKLKCN